MDCSSKIYIQRCIILFIFVNMVSTKTTRAPRKLDKKQIEELKNKTMAHIERFRARVGKEIKKSNGQKPVVRAVTSVTAVTTGLAVTADNGNSSTTKRDKLKEMEEQEQHQLEEVVLHWEGKTTKSAAWEFANRFSPRITTERVRPPRTSPHRIYFEEDCDYIATYCLKAYETGTLCGRTMYYVYQTFDNYCLLDYVNCMERYELWQVVHMGECFSIYPLTEYIAYPYDDDYFLDDYYVIEMA